MMRACETCGGQFEPPKRKSRGRSKRRYCSDRCRTVVRQLARQTHGQCIVCGAAFTMPITRYNHSRQKYCSTACRGAGKKQAHIAIVGPSASLYSQRAQLPKLLKGHGLNRQILAQRIGVHAAIVGRWCSGQFPIPERRVPQIADKLGMTVAELIDALTTANPEAIAPSTWEWDVSCLLHGLLSSYWWTEDHARLEQMAGRRRCARCYQPCTISRALITIADKAA